MITRIVPTHKLKPEQIDSMYELMDQYYDGVSRSVFENDLKEKQMVILLMSRGNRQIQGFSTILQVRLKSSHQEFIALFSGDTVLKKEFWGNGALATTFGKYLTRVKLMNPLTHVYWFLISKGYKTYLLMTNNFPTHFPRYEYPISREYKDILDTFYSSRFKESYQSEQMIIRFEKNKLSSLKFDVAEISEDLRKNKRISYFEKMNPGWHSGDELACVAKVTLWIPIRYAIKRTFKTLGIYKSHS